MTLHEPRRDHDDGLNVCLRCYLERGVEVVPLPDLQGLKLYAQRAGGTLDFPKFRIRMIRVPEDTHPGNPGRHLFEECQSLSRQLVKYECHPRDVSTRAREARHEPHLDRIVTDPHDDWDRSDRLLGGRGHVSTEREDDVGLQAYQISGEIGEPLGLPLRETVLDGEVLPLDVSEVTQRLAERRDVWIRLGSAVQENPHPRDLP